MPGVADQIEASERRAKVHKVVDSLINLGIKNDLGGNGEPVGIVLVYANQAYVNVSWAGNPEDRMKALVDAAAAEGLKKDEAP